MFEVKDCCIHRSNVLSFVIVMGSQHFYVVGCYNPPNNLCSLPQVKQALNKCPEGHTPLLIGDLTINLRSRSHTQRRWMWRMRRGRRWVTSQCDYFLGWATNHRKFCSVCLHHPFNHASDHQAIIIKFAWEAQQRWQSIASKWQNSQLNSPKAL